MHFVVRSERKGNRGERESNRHRLNISHELSANVLHIV